jgi:hypothetical protein
MLHEQIAAERYITTGTFSNADKSVMFSRLVNLTNIFRPLCRATCDCQYCHALLSFSICLGKIQYVMSKSKFYLSSDCICFLT